MSHWDFGRPTDGQHDTPQPSWQAGAAYLPGPPDDAGDGAWPADGRWPAAEDWPPASDEAAGDEPPAGSWPPDDGWDDDEGLGPYPLTYERDDFTVPPSPPSSSPETAPGPGPWEPWPPAPQPDEFRNAGAGTPAVDVHGEQAPAGQWSGSAEHGQRDTAASSGWTGRDFGLPGEDPADRADGGRRRRVRRWLLPAGVIAAGAAVGAAAVMLTSGHPGARGNPGAAGSVAPPATRSTAPSAPASTAPSRPAAAPLTLTQAQAVLASYTTANNSANSQRNETQLATAETGSSFAIDAGLYVTQSAAGTAPYPPFGPVQATYYIPGNEPASGPRWFVVQVANAFTANPKNVTSNEYLLFTQSASGSTWQDTIEPYLLSGADNPQIQTGTDGTATAVSPDAATVAVMPSQLPAATAASLDGTGTGTGQVAIADPGNLTDRTDQKSWQGKVTGGTVTDTHTAAAGANGQEFALRTTDGGALVFYTDAAHLTITPPAGSTLRLTIPGLYTSQQTLTQATVGYLEQFAAYDPPAAAGSTPRITADYSGITGKN